MSGSKFTEDYFKDDLNQGQPKKLKECVDQLRTGISLGECCSLLDKLATLSVPIEEDQTTERVNTFLEVKQLKRFLYHIDRIYPGK